MITLRCCLNGPRLIQMLPVTRMYCSKDTTQPMFDPMKKVCDILMSCPKSGLDTELDQSGIRPSKELVEEVIKRFENAGMLVHRFFEWAGRQRHYDHSVKAYHAMIESLAKIRQYQVMWDLVNVMKGKGLLNVETFCIIMRKYARAKKVEEAVYTFNVMKKYDVPPNLSALNGLLSALCKSKNVRKAQEIFDSMKDRFTPDVKTYSILLEGWGREPNLPKAREIYKEIHAPDIVTYGIMVDILCKAGRVDEAVGIVKEMELGECKPTSFIYSVLIHTYGIYNRIEDAIDAFHEMQKSGAHPDVAVYNSLIGAFCKVKRYKNAYKVISEMERVGVPPNSRTCNVILSGLISDGETDEASRVFRKMIKICDPDADTYTMMIKMFCANKEIIMARKIWKHMKASQFVPGMHTFSVLINGMCDEGDPRRACKLMEEMIEKGMRPDRETFGKLRHLLLKEDRKDVLEFLHEKMDLLVKEPLCD